MGYFYAIGGTSNHLRKYCDRLEEEWKQYRVELEDGYSGKLRQAEEDARAHKANLEVAKDELKEAIAKLKETHSECDNWQKRAEIAEAKLQQFREQYQNTVDSVKILLEDDFKAKLEEQKNSLYADYLKKVKERNFTHRQREAFLLNQLAELDEKHKTQWQEAAARYEGLLDEYQTVLDSFHPEIANIKGIFNEQMSAVVEERNRIYNQLATYHAATRFTGSTKADINGNRLIDFFLEQGITCDADHCESHFEYDEVWIRPRTSTLEGLEKLSSAIQLQFELLKKPEFSIEQGCVKVVLRTHTKEKSSAIKTIEEQPENWLEDVVRESNHYRISAPTDSGKSVLLDNLINCLKLLHGEEFKADLLDPKFPFTDWTGITPVYQGFAQCIAGMERLGELIDGRLAEASADVKAGRAIRTYPAHLFAIDELEIMVDEARGLDNGALKGRHSVRLARLLRKGLKLGRGLTKQKGKGIIVAYVTQSPLCSRINLNKDDFDNSTNLFLGENIPRALSEELNTKLSDKQLAYLMKQYELRKERGDEYFVLVKTPKQAFIATLPPEGYYSSLFLPRLANYYPEALGEEKGRGDEHPSLNSNINQDSGDSSPQSPQSPTPLNQPPIEGGCFETKEIKCPHCGSKKIGKNGRKRGVQYYKCKNSECNKQFSEPTI